MTTLLQRWFGSAPEPLSQPSPRADVDLLDPQAIADYRQVAKTVGVGDQALDIEEFRIFLDKHDLPTFSRSEVVTYMDRVAARDNPTGLGWHWCPVREKDAKIGVTFGTPSEQVERIERMGNSVVSRTVTSRSPASDYYAEKIRPYARIIPLHALKKIALIEARFHPDKVRFLVSDYTLVPHVITKTEVITPVPQPPLPRVNPDPFLMAVIPNADVGYGAGTFIIDVWDEPGFRLEQRLKPSDKDRLVVR